MAALAMLALQAPSLLACDKARAEGHVHPIDGMERVPCDTPMRDILAPVSPTWLRPVFPSVLRPRQRGTARAPLVCCDDGSLVALDGTGDVASTTLHGASCLHKVHRNGSVTAQQQR